MKKRRSMMIRSVLRKLWNKRHPVIFTLVVGACVSKNQKKTADNGEGVLLSSCELMGQCTFSGGTPTPTPTTLLQPISPIPPQSFDTCFVPSTLPVQIADPIPLIGADLMQNKIFNVPLFSFTDAFGISINTRAAAAGLNSPTTLAGPGVYSSLDESLSFENSGETLVRVMPDGSKYVYKRGSVTDSMGSTKSVYLAPAHLALEANHWFENTSSANEIVGVSSTSRNYYTLQKSKFRLNKVVSQKGDLNVFRDDLGYIARITLTGEHEIIILRHNTSHFITFVKQKLGPKMEYVAKFCYNERNQLARVTNTDTVAGTETVRYALTYDDQSRVMTEETAWNQGAALRFNFTYDSQHRQLTGQGPELGERFERNDTDGQQKLIYRRFPAEEMEIRFSGGNIITAITNDGSYYFEYDGDRLIGSLTPDTRTIITYDPDRVLAVNTLDLASDAETKINFDRYQNRSSVTEGNIETQLFWNGPLLLAVKQPALDLEYRYSSYDARNNPQEIETSDHGRIATTKYTYDNLGRVIHASANDSNSSFVSNMEYFLSTDLATRTWTQFNNQQPVATEIAYHSDWFAPTRQFESIGQRNTSLSETQYDQKGMVVTENDHTNILPDVYAASRTAQYESNGDFSIRDEKQGHLQTFSRTGDVNKLSGFNKEVSWIGAEVPIDPIP